jgi:hypothetical protein
MSAQCPAPRTAPSRMTKLGADRPRPIRSSSRLRQAASLSHVAHLLAHRMSNTTSNEINVALRSSRTFATVPSRARPRLDPRDQPNRILLSQRAPTPCLTVRLHLPPGPAHRVLRHCTPEQRSQNPPYPARVGAGQVGACDQRLHLFRHPRVAWQRLAVPLLARPTGFDQPGAWHADRHEAK